MLQRKDGRLFGIRLISPLLDDEEDAETVVDVLLGCCGVEAEVIAAAEFLEVMPNIFIPVARPGHLVALKVLAGRPQDLEDVRNLLREMGAEDLRIARETVDLIERRGFNERPERNLLTELGKLVDESNSNQDF